MTAPTPTDHPREVDALVAGYALLRAIGRRHREQLAALADAERGTRSTNTDDERPAGERAA